MRELGLMLKHFRENSELSQQQVANILNVDRSTYTYYEIGKTTPSASTLLKLSKIFNVPCAVFLETINQELNLNSKVADILDDDDLDGDATSKILGDEEKIYNLSRDEQSIIISYRVLSDDKQRRLEKYIQKLAKEK